MEFCSSLQSLPSPLLSHRGFRVTEKPLGSSCKVPTLKRHPHARNLKGCSFRAQAVSGEANSGSGLVEDAPEKANIKDKKLVFVAGATGKVGSRTVRELLKLGFRVRAGVRSTQKAEGLVQSVEQMKVDFEDGSKAVEKLDIVECDLEMKDGIRIALGNASVVICCIGASEKEVFDITGPYRIDFKATKNLVDAATVAKVDHFILVTSLGTNKFGFPAAILNLFWGVLCWKRKAEEALVASGIPYTIVRPGGMERPTDAYKETHNITLSQEDTLFGGQVSNLQVAELMAVMARNPELSYCKVVEVIAETTAPLTPMEDLLAKIPSKRPLPKVPDSASEVKPAVSKGEVSMASSSLGQKEVPQAKSTLAKPLSPYIVYEDLKPPTSPTPTPRTSSPATGENDTDALTAASSPAPSSIPEQLSNTVLEEAPKIEAKKTTSLSPYIAYDDLKPPTSPAPTPPSGQKEKVLVDTAPKPDTTTTETISETPEPAIQEQIAQPLSPYVVYEDMNLPTSSSPTAGGPQVVIPTGTTSTEFLSPSTGGNDAIENMDAGVDKKDPPLKVTSSQSPYVVYDDLKPPTSPSPNAPNGAVSPSSPNGRIPSITDNTAQSPTEDKVAEDQNQPTVRPLSPYTMYEDLKPPSSPAPLPPFPKNSS